MHGYSLCVANHRGNPVEDQLRSYLQDIQKFSLELDDIEFTPEIIALATELLCQQLPQGCATSENANKEGKWRLVKLRNCSLTSSDRGGVVTNECECTPDELHRLCSVVSSRAQELWLQECAEIVASWTSFPQSDPIVLESLVIFQRHPLSPLQYARLGEIIQKSPQLQKLRLYLPLNEAPLLFDRLASTLHLRELWLSCEHGSSNDSDSKSVPGLSAVVRLLQNPLSRLHTLHLWTMVLDDSHIATIAQALPISQLRLLSVYHETTQFQGLLEFAHQLPRIQTLKRVFIHLKGQKKFPEQSIDNVECCNALVQGLMANYSIERMGIVEDAFNGLQADLMRHYISLNCAGRRILATSLPVPAGLWPLVLKRAMKDSTYECYKRRQSVVQANAVFFFLKNCPVISGNHGFHKGNDGNSW